MGKPEEDRRDLTERGATEVLDRNVERSFCRGCRFSWISSVIGLRCFLVLILSFGLLLSALFLLPPFRDLGDHSDRDPYSEYRGHQIVASFKVKKPVSFLQENVLQLEKDIFDEIGVRTTKVVIVDLKPSLTPNVTSVIFAVDSERKDSKVIPTARSLIRESFESLVINESSLHLTDSVFGEPFFFQVLKFQGGILVSPRQQAFPLQEKQNLLNFTLNYSIDELLQNFGTLASQLKIGLHLAPYENLFVSLSSSRGSTVFPPAAIQSYVVMAVGNSASMPRLKQLAQSIKGSDSRNLGLNNTVFGRVKQVRLSSILQHFLNGGERSGTSPSPSPALSPEIYVHSHHHHHHHNHHRHHLQDHKHHFGYLPPEVSPSPAPNRHGAPAPTPAGATGSSPSPESGPSAKPPSCSMGMKRKPGADTRKGPLHSAPSASPSIQHHPFASTPHHFALPPANARSLHHPGTAYAQPPWISKPGQQWSDQVASPSPSPSPSCADSLIVKSTIVLSFIATAFSV